MKLKSLSPSSAAASSHWTQGKRLAGVLGVMAGAAVLALVTILFDEASSMPWLQPTSEHVLLLEPCGRLQGTAARRMCVETVVAAVQARASETTVASYSPAPVLRNQQ